MNAVFDNINGPLFLLLLISMVIAAIYAGKRLGQKNATRYVDVEKSHIIGMQGSVLGLLSFLLAFTFSIAIHHFDERTLAMMEEANAIGTTWLRAQNLPVEVKSETLATLKKYLNTRVKEEEIPLHKIQERKVLLDEGSQLRSQLWELATQSVKYDDRITTTGLYIQSLNHMIDSWGSRDEALNRHIPVLVIFLLVCFVVFSAGLIGYTSAINRHQLSKVSILYLIAIVILTYVLIDLDRPRRGIIQVSHKNMIELQAEINR